MGNLYLIDKPYGSNGLALAQQDQEAAIVLIQDGVYLDASEASRAGRPVYAVKRDVERRGLNGKLSTEIKTIGFDELVDLILENRVINFA